MPGNSCQCIQTQYPWISYALHKLNRLTGVTCSGGSVSTPAVTYTYNLANQLISEQNPHARTVTTTYDRVGRPTSLIGSLAGIISTYHSKGYGLFGLLDSMARGNNVWHVRTYNSSC